MHLRTFKQALIFHAQFIKTGIKLPIFTYNNLLHLYSKEGLLYDAQKVFDEMPKRNVFTWNTVIAAYLKNHDLNKAESLFYSSPHKDLVTYNAMLSGYVIVEGCEFKGVNLFFEMLSGEGKIGVDEFTVSTMLNLIAKWKILGLGVQFHAYMVKNGNYLSGFCVSSLIDMYSKCGCFREAMLVFDGCDGKLDLVSKNAMAAACCREGELELGLKIFWREPGLNDTVSWNTMISGFVQNGYYEESLKFFRSMLESRIQLNEHTFTGVLPACSGVKNLKLGKEVHGRVLKHGMVANPYIASAIVDVYCKCGDMKYAELANALSGKKNNFSISSMIVGYSSKGYMEEARRHFDSLDEKNSVVWTALFTGYLNSGQSKAVFELLEELLAKESVVRDALILMSVLGACAILASLDLGKQIHCYILRTRVEKDEKLVSAIIDMYSKCGDLTYAERNFQVLNTRDTVLYNVMIAAYAHHGHEGKAISLFQEMSNSGIRPDAATFVALLSACRHAGLVELGEKYFNSMIETYKIRAEVNHYACMIDLYGRASQLQKAEELIRKMPIEPDSAIWGAFLNACRVNRNIELAREAENVLLSIEGHNGSRYVQLANVYADNGNWDEVGRIRKKMKEREVKKFAGCSWLYMENGTNIFTSGDISHSKSEAIYFLLACLTQEINHVTMLERSGAIL